MQDTRRKIQTYADSIYSSLIDQQNTFTGNS